MIDAQAVQDGRLHVIDVHRILDDVIAEGSAYHDAEVPTGRPWQPGQSWNPRGRPPVSSSCCACNSASRLPIPVYTEIKCKFRKWPEPQGIGNSTSSRGTQLAV